MTDRLEAARAFVAAGDALNSPEHAADVEQLREISNRVTAREEAFKAAQDALFAADAAAVETGAEPAADNVEAQAVLFGQMQQSTLADWVTPRPEAAADRTCPPADNAEAEAVLFGQTPADDESETIQSPSGREFVFSLNDEFSSSRANGAYAED